MPHLQRPESDDPRDIAMFVDSRLDTLRGEIFEHIDRKFDEFIHWVEDTMTTEDNPFIQVIAVLRGEAQ